MTDEAISEAISVTGWASPWFLLSDIYFSFHGISSSTLSLAMREAPSLMWLAVEAVAHELVSGDCFPMLSVLRSITSHLFAVLVTKLPPLALSKLPFENSDNYEHGDGFLTNGKKRGRNKILNEAWKALFVSRWPKHVENDEVIDWQQLYWQTHLQNCLDDAAEMALLPSFDGSIGMVKISDKILKYIGSKEMMNHSMHSKLSFHFQEFGHYVRSLRLQNVFFDAETCQLLRNCKLQSLDVRWIRSKEQVYGLCQLLIQNVETLTSLELIHCRLSSDCDNEICRSMCLKNTKTHMIQKFSFVSSFIESKVDKLPAWLSSFLYSGGCLQSLKFRDNNMGPATALMLFCALIDTSSFLSVLELSENSISGWLSVFGVRSSSISKFGAGKSLRAVRVLTLRGNDLHKDDVENLADAVVYMPSLEVLDLSGNPIEDRGIRSLASYFKKAPERFSSLTELNLANCDISCIGAIDLLGSLSSLKIPLRSLSLEDNYLGSHVAGAMARVFGTCMEVLNIGGIGLGPAGFLVLQEGLLGHLKLVRINICKNHGGAEAARFLSRLIPLALEITSIDASYNIMPHESITMLLSVLEEVRGGNLEQLNLTGNLWNHELVHDFLLERFQHKGKPVFILSSFLEPDVPYDDDP